MLWFRRLLNVYLKSSISFIDTRYLHGVHHDPGIFYVKLSHNDSSNVIDRAVLLYNQTGRVLDMYAVKVPKIYAGQGLGRLLAEAAFTYVIVRNYRMYLTCTYLQAYFKRIKTQHLSIYVVGPSHILEGIYPESMLPTIEADKLEGMPDPIDTENKFNKD